MNIVKLQYIKLTQRNLLHSYTLTMRKQKEKLRKQSFTIATKRIKYLRVYLPKETKDLYIENYKSLMKEIRGHKQMVKYTVLMDWKNQYCENDYTTQSNL